MTCNCIGGNPCPCMGGKLPMGRLWISPPQEIRYGVYECRRCKKSYTVLDQWAECTPDFCHDCYAHLKAQYALIPVDKDGKDVAQ
jgi:hypothetical protein